MVWHFEDVATALRNAIQPQLSGQEGRSTGVIVEGLSQLSTLDLPALPFIDSGDGWPGFHDGNDALFPELYVKLAVKIYGDCSTQYLKIGRFYFPDVRRSRSSIFKDILLRNFAGQFSRSSSNKFAKRVCGLSP